MTKLGIRYYDPTLGRFTQVDPTGQDPHYTYAANSTLNFTDPSGASILGDCGKGAAITLTGTAAGILGASLLFGPGSVVIGPAGYAAAGIGGCVTGALTGIFG